MLLQFGTKDPFVKNEAATAMGAPSTGPKTVKTYEFEHELTYPGAPRPPRVAERAVQASTLRRLRLRTKPKALKDHKENIKMFLCELCALGDLRVERSRGPFSNNPFTTEDAAASFARSSATTTANGSARAKDQYEPHVRAPMIAGRRALAEDFRTVAPELIASPKQSLFRIYRDTRFSSDKKPLKTHAAAVFRTRHLPRPQGAGLYFEIAPGWVWIGGGMWRPEPPELVRMREHIAETWPEIRAITRAAAFRRRFEELSGDTMTRVPRGYSSRPSGGDVPKHRQFYGGAEFPASLAHSREFYPTLIATFKALMPLVAVSQRAALEPAGPGPGARWVRKYLPISW